MGILSAMSSMFISIFIFDLDTNNSVAYKSNEHIDNWTKGIDGAQEQTFNVMKNIAKSEHVDAILAFTDFSTLRERLKGKLYITEVFEGKFNGWCRARFAVMNTNDKGEIKQVIYTVECIDEEKKRENYLLYLAQTDLMTNICNRGFGEKAIGDYIKEKRKGLFCLFDVDKFKRINDQYGHDVGDTVLIKIAECMKKIKHDGDIIMRLGGDEFAIYFVDVIDKDMANARVGELLTQIDRLRFEEFQEKISVSLGAVAYSEGSDFDSLYKAADEGVYISKARKGSSSYIVM